VKSVTHGQHDARPITTFPAVRHHCPATDTKLHRLETEVHVCNKYLAQDCYMAEEWPRNKPVTLEVRHSDHYITSNIEEQTATKSTNCFIVTTYKAWFHSSIYKTSIKMPAT